MFNLKVPESMASLPGRVHSTADAVERDPVEIQRAQWRRWQASYYLRHRQAILARAKARRAANV